MSLRGRGNELFMAVALVLCLAPKARAETRSEIADLVERAGPSVVNIQTARFLKSSKGRRLQNPWLSPDQPLSALGTGFVVQPTELTESSGDLHSVWILTNAHVVEGATDIEVLPVGGSLRYLARVFAVAKAFDVALLQAKIPKTIQGLRLGNSRRLRVGESVVAIGNPFGLGHTVTAGILSAKDRSLGVSAVTRYLQTDAAINFGNSGGPLFNLRGEVIGMNTLVRVYAQGIGFAIPSDTLSALLSKLVQGESPQKLFLGLRLDYWSTAWSRQLGVEGDSQSLIVTQVERGSPAAGVGLVPGDRLLKVQSKDAAPKTLEHPGDLEDFLLQHKAGDALVLTLRRGAQLFEARLVPSLRTLQKRDSSDGVGLL